MKTKYMPFLFLVFVLLSGNIYAQQTMTLEKCRELALENNKAIAIAARNKDKSEYIQKSYWANYFPKISASGNYLYTNTEMNKTMTGNYLPTFIPDPVTGQLVPNILAVNPDGTPVFKEYAYFPDMDILLKLASSYQKVVTEFLRNVQDAQEVGLKHKNDVLKVQVKVNEAELQVRQAENGVRLSRKNLCYIMGIPLDSEVLLPKPFGNARGWKTSMLKPANASIKRIT